MYPTAHLQYFGGPVELATRVLRRVPIIVKVAIAVPVKVTKRVAIRVTYVMYKGSAFKVRGLGFSTLGFREL